TKETSGLVEGKSSVSTFEIFGSRNQTIYEEQKQIQHSAAENLYNNFKTSKDFKTAVNSAAEWLKKQNSVKSVTVQGERLIIIKYTSGVTGGVMIREVDQNGKPLYLGDIRGTDTLNRNRTQLRSFEQTRGEYYAIPNIEADTNIIFNKKVIVWSPCEDEFSPNVPAEIINRINKNKLGLTIDHFPDFSATVDLAQTFCNYGLIVIMAHGAYGQYFQTKERASETNNAIYQDLLDSDQICSFTQVDICKIFGIVPVVTYDVYALMPKFILNLGKRFAKSVIVSISCEGAQIPDHNPQRSYALAFIKKGASTFVGYTGLTTAEFANQTAPNFVERLVVDEKTTHEAFISNEDGDNKFVMHSPYKVRYTSGLINGFFEYPVIKYGQVAGWESLGDARVLAKLGSITPAEGKYMGIVSTGLGFTTSSGEYSQTFRIKENESKLSVKWNFLSEEFLEYIGSSYQDKFKIVIKDIESGLETILLEKSIDQIAAQFGATKESSGSLAAVSPDIKFDHGDVYSTGWQANEFDMSFLRGKLIRLSISVSDVGDSAFDTAVLLDEISIK
ncbi:MAG: choice-of-anchor L domain-containing protein, partial [Methanococcaceae archaeon]